MPTGDKARQRHQQKPPPGFLFIDDYTDPTGTVTPGIATRLGISVSTYRKWLMAKKGPATFRHGSRLMAREDVVDAYRATLGQDATTLAEAAAQAAEHDTRPPEPRRPPRPK